MEVAMAAGTAGVQYVDSLSTPKDVLPVEPSMLQHDMNDGLVHTFCQGHCRLAWPNSLALGYVGCDHHC